jgi:radical SAM enzyme (rSAM/lipoprotein system)
MDCRLSFPKRLVLETGRAALRTEVLEHTLTQLFWECTLRCNLSCRHCGSDCRKTAGMADPPLSDLLGVLDSSPKDFDRGRCVIVTTGGEPMVRKDIMQVGAEIKKRGFLWGMVSNGMLLTREAVNELVETGLDTIGMSFDGFEDEHNWMRGSELSFKRADAAIDWFKEHKGLTWDLITCVNQRNFGSLEKFKEYLISRGVRQWRIFTVAPMGRAAGDDDLMLTNEQYVQLLNFIASVRREGRIRLNYSCEGFLGPYEGVVRDHVFRCVAGLSVASIRYDGAISGCLSIRSDYNQGNIHTDNFWDLWENSFKLYRDRKWMKKDECGDCKVWRYCQGGAMHLRDAEGKILSCNYLKIKNAGE